MLLSFNNTKIPLHYFLHPEIPILSTLTAKAMADRLAIPLWTESNVLVSEKLLGAQGDIRFVAKTVDTLLIEFDQQAFEEYLSIGSEGQAAHMNGLGSRALHSLLPMQPRLTLLNRAPMSSQLQAMTSYRWWGPSPPLKRNRSAERNQRRCERCQQLSTTMVPSSPLDLSCVSLAKCKSSVQSRLGCSGAKSTC